MLATLTHVFWELWKLVDVFTCVAAVGNAEAEVKIKILEQAIFEVVPLDHPEVCHRLLSHCKLHTERKKSTDQAVNTQTADFFFKICHGYSIVVSYHICNMRRIFFNSLP